MRLSPFLLLLMAALVLPTGAAALDLEAMAKRFDHPERYRLLFSRLINRGVPVARVKAAFSSEKALERDHRAVELRTDVGRIPEHQAAEREANERYLAEARTLADHLREHADLYRRMESAYRIRSEIIGAILLKESALGEYDGFGHDAFVVFNSLHDGLEVTEDASPRLRRRIPRLIQMAREQLIALVIHAYRNDLALEETVFPASYAGAIGIPQWLPVHLDYAVSADDSPPDLSRLTDAVLSTANLIRNKFGWPEAMLDFARLSNLDEIVVAWRRFDDGSASFATDETSDGQPVHRFDRANADMPNVTYVATFVRALMRYNYSSEYGLGVLRIAHRAHQLRGEDE
ncbi:lytic murein transglycosylase [Thiohalorhabdus sp.]|uniref:lytic murein transglycosylase n=1 Tax=Thiohalorhabdus sp. TaxID=3094134 RepID=UPI002FC3B3EA